MNVQISKVLLSFALALVLILTSVLASAAPPEGMFPPRGLRPMLMPSGLVADKEHLYVVVGPKIMQYGLADLKLVKTVDLPKPALPKEQEAMPWPPLHPPMGGPPGLWAGEGSLYVLAGPMLYRFSTPDLTLKTTTELPKPEPPKAEK
jgi:hypothetical protein